MPSAWARISSAFPLVGGKRGEHFGKCSPLSPPFNFFCLFLRKAVAFLVRSFAFSLSCRTSFGSFFPKAWPSFFFRRSRLSFRPYFGYYSERFSFASGFCRAFLPGKRARVSRLFMTGDTKRNLDDRERGSFSVFFCRSFSLFFFVVLAYRFNAIFLFWIYRR